jgi:hypothetical protein
MQTFETIVNKFPISSSEYEELEQELGKLAYYAAWELQKRNSKNSITNETEDDVQEMRIALIRAGSYYKRQTYIESCFDVLDKFVKGRFVRRVLKELKHLWAERKRHGANRQKFGEFQENLLDRMITHWVPEEYRPDRTRRLFIDPKFRVYAKQILWNSQKALGKHITREKSIRNGMVSLSSYDYLGSTAV